MNDLKIIKNIKDIDISKYILVDYFIKSNNLDKSIKSLAIGQSIGNPEIRNEWESNDLINNHCCIILKNEENATIAFPLENINIKEDGISQLLVQIMGGQLDIDIFDQCHVKNITFPENTIKNFLGPYHGISGIRKYTEVKDKPILGGIIKPKIGITPKILLEMVKQMVEGGVNFIKEDEIMSNPNCCKLDERVPLIMDYINSCGRKIIYAVCINSDYPYVIDRVKKVKEYGGNAIHVNFWNGLGIYKTIREMDSSLFIFFQKSGDKILTDTQHRFHIDWDVICKLSGMMGVDFIHAGMWGGYSSQEEKSLKKPFQF